jgi:hypothetical protein
MLHLDLERSYEKKIVSYETEYFSYENEDLSYEVKLSPYKGEKTLKFL